MAMTQTCFLISNVMMTGVRVYTSCFSRKGKKKK